MLRQLLQRSLVGIGIIFAVVTVTFILISMAPGDPVRLWVAPDATDLQLEAARQALGLDEPIIVRYTTWIGAFLTGNWGTSISTQQPVTTVILNALPFTIQLAVASLLITYLGGVAMGLVQAMKHRTVLDTGLTVVSLVLFGIPAYWLAIMLVLLFTYSTARLGFPGWLQFPAFGAIGLDADFLSPWDRFVDRIRHIALPLVTLGLIGIGGTARFVRGAVLDVRQLDFVKVARSKGIADRAVEIRHVLRNALVPVVTLLGLALPALVSGVVFVETIFAWPGMGRVMVTAVTARDYPVVMATTAMFAALVVVGNMLADLAAAGVDPRLRAKR